jgi:hypothetical protein
MLQGLSVLKQQYSYSNSYWFEEKALSFTSKIASYILFTAVEPSAFERSVNMYKNMIPVTLIN